MAMHFRDTDGPGCIVCSENLKSSTGRASEKTSDGPDGDCDYHARIHSLQRPSSRQPKNPRSQPTSEPQVARRVSGVVVVLGDALVAALVALLHRVDLQRRVQRNVVPAKVEDKRLL